MNKKYQLHTGIKDIIQTNGTEPIRTVQLARSEERRVGKECRL